MDKSPPLSRRTILSIAATTPLLGAEALGSHAAAAPAPSSTPRPSAPAGLDLDDPVDFLAACLKMRGALDDRLVIGFTIGRYYGLVEDQTTLLYGLLAASFSVYRPRRDGGYDNRTFEIAYFTDLATGQPLETFVNPYTNRRVKVPQTRIGPTDRVFTAEARQVSKGLPAGSIDDDRYLPAVVVGDDVWITEQFNFSAPPPPPGKPAFHYTELTTAHARKSDLDDPRRTRVPTTTSTQIAVSWRPWLEMTDLRGHMLLTSAGRMLERVEDLPQTYLELGRRHHPDVLQDPDAFMRRGWA